MSTSGKTHDDGLRGLLRDRFEDFEPEAPELFNAIADSRHTAAKPAVRRFVPGMIAVMLLMVTHPLDDRGLPQEINAGRTEERAYPTEPALHTVIDQPVGGNEGSRAALRNYKGATRRVTFAEAGAPGQSAAEPTAAITDGDLPAPGSAPDYTPLLPPAMQFSSGLVARPVAAAKDERQEESPVKMRKGRLSVHGALGVNYTQYLLTVLPQENMSIGDLSFPDPGEKVNWRLQGSLGIDYDKWQLRLTYQEFTQKLSFLENRGNVEVAYSGAGDYTITPVTVQVSSEKNFRVAGLYLRRIQPVKSTGLYIGAGAGYLAGLKGEHQGIWGQAFAGHHKRLSPTMDFFYETQFNYSFRPFRLADPSLTFRPYQVGLSAGIRWNRGNR